MTETFATAPGAVDNTQGVAAMSRLADRLAAVAPPAPVLELTRPMQSPPPRFSPAVTAALSTSAAINARAAERARRSRSVIGILVDSFTAACSFIPYALVALALRLVIARLFFLDGQTRIEGPHLSYNFQGFDFSVVLPLQVKAETFTAFLTQYAAVPVPPVLAAYLVSYAEFILPIMLVVGFGTRFAALGLLIMTALIQVYVMPQELWSVHVYWASILMVLLALGPGRISVDAIVRLVARR
jgi:putative oxidoreductase